jgi:hypothetical protein
MVKTVSRPSYTLSLSQASSGLFPFLEWVAASFTCKPPSAIGLDTVFLFRQCSRVFAPFQQHKGTRWRPASPDALVPVHGSSTAAAEHAARRVWRLGAFHLNHSRLIWRSHHLHDSPSGAQLHLSRRQRPPTNQIRHQYRRRFCIAVRLHMAMFPLAAQMQHHLHQAHIKFISHARPLHAPWIATSDK